MKMTINGFHSEPSLRSSDGLGLDHGDDIREVLRGTKTASGVDGEHDLDLDTDGTSAQVAVAGGGVDELLVSGTGLDHEAVAEGDGLGTLALDLATDGDLATLSTRLHNVADHVGGSAADLEVGQKLEAERLHLSHGGEATGLNAVNEDVKGTLLVAEALSDAGADLTHTLVLATEDLAALRHLDGHLSAKGGHAGLHTSEAFLSKLALEELEKLGVLHTIANDRTLL